MPPFALRGPDMMATVIDVQVRPVVSFDELKRNALTKHKRIGLLVEQNVHQTLAIAQHGWVLSQGRVVTSGTAKELAQKREVPPAHCCKDTIDKSRCCG